MSISSKKHQESVQNREIRNKIYPEKFHFRLSLPNRDNLKVDNFSHSNSFLSSKGESNEQHALKCAVNSGFPWREISCHSHLAKKRDEHIGARKHTEHNVSENVN